MTAVTHVCDLHHIARSEEITVAVPANCKSRCPVCEIPEFLDLNNAALAAAFMMVDCAFEGREIKCI